jgi:hypothetical protein
MTDTLCSNVQAADDCVAQEQKTIVWFNACMCA